MRNHCLAVLALGFLATSPARAAEGLDSCTGFITTLPATLATPGTWCLSGDLSTQLQAGAAITIAVNNVSVDCNGFKLGNLAAGAGNGAVGVASGTQANAAVRNCNIRGFQVGVSSSGPGTLVEDNRLEGSGVAGIDSRGGGGMIRRNQIRDTGGAPLLSSYVTAILVVGDDDVLDNTIDGVIANGDTTSFVSGVYAGDTNGAVVAGNRIRGVDGFNAGNSFGVNAPSESRIVIRDNDFVAVPTGNDFGVYCTGLGSASARNTYARYNIAVNGCMSWEDVVVGQVN